MFSELEDDSVVTSDGFIDAITVEESMIVDGDGCFFFWYVLSVNVSVQCALRTGQG